MLTEAIILAGGLGTRLRSEVPDLPKCLAPVAGRPFLFYLINHLRSQGIHHFIFSLGYKHEVIGEWLKEQYPFLDYDCVIEEEPLGTGGAIRLACEKTNSLNVLVANGDTLFKVHIEQLTQMHEKNKADCTIALKPMQNFDRYGVVEINESGKVMSFREKQFYSSGFINGGIYILNKEQFLSHSFPPVFSFERSFLEPLHSSIYGSAQDGYFIDIGIPEDFHRANEELKPVPLNLGNIDKSWTLFIDRDGVINHEKKEDYIRHLAEFQLYDGVTEAMRLCSEKFGKIIIVSNQRGVGRGLMTEENLREIHQHLEHAIQSTGGRIDAIYYCTATDNRDFNRKPNPGMAFRAKADIPGIDLSRSIMIGNKPSDMMFGRYAGLYTVFAATTNPETPYPHPDIDLRFNSLGDFAKAL